MKNLLEYIFRTKAEALVGGSWSVVHGSWSVVRGSWFMVCGSWSVVHGMVLLSFFYGGGGIKR